MDDPRTSGVRIRRIPRLIGGDIHSLKLLRQLWFYACALPMLVFRRRPDLIVTQTNPPLVVPIAVLAARLHRRPCMIIAQDIYPEVMRAHGMIDERSWSAGLLTRVFGWAYRSARAIVSLGPVMTERLLAKGVSSERIIEICNWATGDETVVRGEANRLRDEWGLAGCFVLLYSGNLGIAHDVETPIRAMQDAQGPCAGPQARLRRQGQPPRPGEGPGPRARAGGCRAVPCVRAVRAAAAQPGTRGCGARHAAAGIRGSRGAEQAARIHGARGADSVRGPGQRRGEAGRAVERRQVRSGGSRRRVCGHGRAVGPERVDLRASGEAAAAYYDAHLSKAKGLAAYRNAVARAAGRELPGAAT